MKLTYFNFYGRVEAIRLMLHASKTEFEDVRLEFSEWGSMKTDQEKFPYGQLPVLENKGKVYCQSMAMFKYVSKICGYTPDDAESQFHVEEAVESCREAISGIFKMYQLKTEEEKKEAMADIKPKIEPSFETWEKNLKDNGDKDHYFGAKDTLADFFFTCFYTDSIRSGPCGEFLQDILSAYPTVKAYFETRAEMHKDYFEKRPKCPY
ncbi:unnamed protein product [Moneuplotes crassus]|uniref:glutathione transferase n=1 Tax=Euplotes crassus TaxID=5936 RepID=A0AAD1XWT2_EUPCR|nr:unnamed protein product [Moneuplotes crassus]